MLQEMAERVHLINRILNTNRIRVSDGIGFVCFGRACTQNEEQKEEKFQKMRMKCDSVVMMECNL